MSNLISISSWRPCSVHVNLSGTAKDQYTSIEQPRCMLSASNINSEINEVKETPVISIAKLRVALENSIALPNV